MREKYCVHTTTRVIMSTGQVKEKQPMSESDTQTPTDKSWWQGLAWGWILWYLVVHAAAFLGLWYVTTRPTFVLFGTVVSKHSSVTLWFAFAQFYYCQICTTCGAHRLFWHHAYDAKRWVQYCLAFGFAGVWQGPLVFWSPKHGDHHRWFDRPGDPHSPWLHGHSFLRRAIGFWWSHMGWVCSKSGISSPSGPSIAAVTRDNACGEVVEWERKYHAKLAVAYFAAPLLLGIFTGDIGGAILNGCFTRVVANYHLTWIVNSVGHTFGRHVDKGDKATNPPFWLALPLGFLTAGEIYHANHHAGQQRWKLGVRWFDIDPGKWVIHALMFFGQAWVTPGRRRRVPR